MLARLMGLVDALGCACMFLSWPPVLALDQLWPIHSSSFTGITPKANVAVEKANPTDSDTSQPPRPKLPQGKSVLFDAVTCLDAQLTTLHAALPLRTAFLIFSGHSDPRVVSALAARRSEFQASLNQNPSQKQDGGMAPAAANGTMTTAAGDGNVVRWTEVMIVRSQRQLGVRGRPIVCWGQGVALALRRRLEVLHLILVFCILCLYDFFSP